MRIYKIALPIFITLIGVFLSLACGGSGGNSNQADIKRDIKVRLAGGKAGDIVNVYALDGTLTAPGTLIATTTYDNATGIALVNLTTGSDYRVCIEIGGYDVLEALILNTDLVNVTTTYNLGVVGATSTLEAWQYYYEDRSTTDPLLAYKERIVAITTGLMIRSLDDGLAQDLTAWNNVKTTLTNAFKSTASYLDITTAATAISQDINFDTMILPSDMSASMATLFASLSTTTIEDLFKAVQTGSPSGILSGTQNSNDLLTLGKSELTTAGGMDNRHFSAFTVTEMVSMEESYLKAHEYFRSAAILDATNEEANFLSALSRLLTFSLRSDSSTTYAMNKLGISWASWAQENDDHDAEKDIDTSNVQYDSSDLPTMAEIGNILSGLISDELTPVVNNLENISSTFNFTLTKELQGHDVTSDLLFDYTDVQAILIWAYALKGKLEYMEAYDFNFAGKTDTRTAMKRFVKDLSGREMIGNATYSITDSSDASISLLPSVIMTAGFLDDIYVTFPNTDIPEISLSPYGSSANTYSGSESYYDANGDSKNFSFTITFDTGSYQSFTGYAYFQDHEISVSKSYSIKGSSTTGITDDNNYSEILETDLVTLLESNTNAATATSAASMADSKASFQKMFTYLDGVLAALQIDTSTRDNHPIPNIEELEKANSMPFSTSEIDGLQSLFLSIRSSLDARTTFDPTVLNSNFGSTTADLSYLFSTNMRDLISNTDGSIYTEIDSIDQETYIDVNSAKHLALYENILGITGGNITTIEDALGTLNDHLEILFDGSELIYSETYSGGNTHSGMFYWDHVSNASQYNLYYKSGGVVSSSDNKYSMASSMFSLNSPYTSLSSLGISDPDGYSFAVSAIVDGNETPLYYLTETSFNFSASHGALDLSNNPYLKSITISGGNSSSFALSSLDITGCTRLNQLEIATQMSSLDLSKNTELDSLILRYFTGTSVSLTNNTMLDELVITDTAISSLDLSTQSKLDFLYLYNNQLSSTLDLSNNPLLSSLKVCYSDISSINLTNNIENVSADLQYNTNLNVNSISGASAITRLNLYNVTAADMTNFTGLDELAINYSTLNVVDVSNNSNLRNLGINSSNVTTMSIVNSGVESFAAANSYFSSLNFSNATLKNVYLYGSSNSVSSINFGSSSALKSMAINSIHLNSSDISNLPNLKYLTLFNNNLSSISTLSNTSLRYINLYGNNLTAIDLSQNANLEALDLYSNSLTTLDISNNPMLLNINAYGNSLPTTEVDSILSSLINRTAIGTLNISGGSNGVPSTSGTANVSTLTNSGWSITVNSNL